MSIKTGLGWTELTRDSSPNFGENGVSYLVKCPQCLKENYSMAVSSGQCCWCLFKLEANEPKQ